ncbi:MAG TPA: hypothetical protein VG410_06395 [Solirubrobacteraceae bacterium]|jgi:hypothetical protein|nr:hypothetical protein [Solirubrobacteraceae bacterium]
MYPISYEDSVRQLDQRSGDGIDVTLLWDSRSNEVFLTVVDERLGEMREFGIPPEDALDAFHHPYAYAA